MIVTAFEGLQKIDLGPPVPATAARAKGFDYGLVAILDKAENLKGYAEHPAHLKYVAQLSQWLSHFLQAQGARHSLAYL